MTAATQQAERDGIDLEAANKRLAAMGMYTANVDEQRKAGIYVDTRMESPADTPADTPAAAPKPARKRRSDAGIPKGPKQQAPAPAVPGALTEAQADTVRALCIARWTAEQDYAHADCALMDADKERTRSEKALNDYLRSLTAK